MRWKRIALVIAACVLSACGSNKATSNAIVVSSAPEVSAMAVDSAGELAYGSRVSGDISLHQTGGGISKIAHVDVSADGQRGLLSLAYDNNDHLFASYTASTGDRRITIEQISPVRRVVWSGPPSVDFANGGHIALALDGRLVTGIGDLLDAQKLNDPNALNGKMLSLDPNGSADQKPTVVSSGWHNPFAFTFRNDGSLWVGDNEPADDSERLARADVGGVPTQIGHVGAHKVASGIAATSDGSLWECTYLGKTLQRYAFDAKGLPIAAGKPVANDCSLGVVVLKDGRLAYSTGNDIRAVNPS